MRKDAEKLDDEGRKAIHSTFAFTLWIGSMGRPDILVVLSFLEKRTNKVGVDGRKKLERLLSYLLRTMA